MTIPAFTFDENTTTVVIDSALRVAEKLQICLMQLAPATGAIMTDASRPAAVAAMRDLLVGGDGHATPALGEMIPGAGPVVIVAPEFAFGSSDWPALDALVRQTQRPILLIAGFGAAFGQKLLDWKVAAQAEGDTARHFGWDDAAGRMSAAMRVNGGWCWIHRPGRGTDCIVYLKNVLEQQHEARELPDIQEGRTILHLRFDDVDLFPLICADLLQPMVKSAQSAQARIHGLLQAAPHKTRPAIVIGSLLQLGYNVNWEIAVDALLNQTMAGRPGVVALCNIAYDNPEANEERDRWRSLTGVYGRWDEMPKGQQNLPVGRSLVVRGITGAVVRRSEPCVATGDVGWSPFSPVGRSFVWHAKMSCPLTVAGMTAPVAITQKQYGCELTRFIRRHPPTACWSPRVAQGLAQISGRIAVGARPDAATMLSSTLGGVGAGFKVDPDALHEQKIEAACRAGLHALATMTTSAATEWQELPAEVGQLRLPATARNLLIWCDTVKSARAMKRDLGAWKLDPSPHPDLVVLGAGPHDGLATEVVEAERRDDISVSPPAMSDLGAGGALAAVPSDITLSRTRRNIATLNLHEVAGVYIDPDLYEGSEARMTALIDAINAFFPIGAAV